MYATWYTFQKLTKNGTEKEVLKYDVSLGGFTTYSLISTPWKQRNGSAYHGGDLHVQFADGNPWGARPA